MKKKSCRNGSYRRKALATLLSVALLPMDLFAGDISPVVGPSVIEVDIEFEARFITWMSYDRPGQSDLEEETESHAENFTHYFESQKTLRRYGLSKHETEGIGAFQKDLHIEILDTQKQKPEYEGNDAAHYLISYRASGRAIIHRRVAEQWLAEGGVKVPMPYELNKYMFSTPAEGARDSQEIHIRVYPALSATGIERYENQSAQLDTIRGDNGNGEVFEIYAVQGFFESFKKKRDYGHRLFNSINRFLKQNGFEQEMNRNWPDRRRHSYVKRIQVSARKFITMRFNHYLGNTTPDGERISYAEFMKEAIEHGDVILYGGHAGYGMNLSFEAINDTLQAFGQKRLRMRGNKKQIYFFDACYTYRYYSRPYRKRAKRKNVDVITYGLTSTFEGADPVWKEFLTVLMDPAENPSWINLLTRMETAMGGGTYLMNVGGL